MKEIVDIHRTGWLNQPVLGLAVCQLRIGPTLGLYSGRQIGR